MQTSSVFLFLACFVGAALTYVFLAIRHDEHTRALGSKLSKTQVELAAVKTKLKGYTQHAQHLETCKQAMLDHFKQPVLKVVRDFVHTEKYPKDKFKLKSEATVIGKYSVEFSIGFEFTPSDIELLDGANGVGMKLRRPSLVGDPVIKDRTHQIVCATDVVDRTTLIAALDTDFALGVRRQGHTLATEDSVRSHCKLRAVEVFRDHLAKQAGVVHVPGIFADYF